MKKHTLLFLACLMATSMLAQKQQRDTLRHIELPEALIRSSKSDSSVEAFRQTWNRNQIQKANGVEDLPYLLNSLPSVVLTSDAGAGTGYTGMRIRGADLSRINVTMNGIPVNDAESQAVYFVDIPDVLSSARELSVSQGVSASKNGVGNFGAGILINNLDVEQTQPGASLQLDGGSFHTAKLVAKAYTGLINGRFTSAIRVSRMHSDGYIQRSASDLNSLQWTSAYHFSDRTQLVFNYMDGHEKTGQAWDGVPQDSLKTNRTYNELGLINDGSYYGNQTDNYTQHYYQLFLDHKINSHVSIGTTLYYTKGKGYYEEYKTNQSFANYHLADPVVGQDTLHQTDLIRRLWLDNDFYGMRAYINYLSPKLDAGLYLNTQQYLGRHFGEVIWSEWSIPTGYRWYQLHADKSEQNGYAMMEYRFRPTLSVLGDIQMRQVQYNIYGFKDNPSIVHHLHYNFVNPKIRFSRQGKVHSSSLLAGIAQKEPNREDLEAGLTSLPKPEKLYDMEWCEQLRLTSSLSFRMTTYLMYYTNQLVLTGKINDVGAYTRSNVPRSYRAGIEAEGAWHPLAFVDLKANIALSRNKIPTFTEYIDDYDQGIQRVVVHHQTDISFSPAVISTIQGNLYPFHTTSHKGLRHLAVNYQHKFVGKQYLDNTQDRDRSLHAFSTGDLTLQCPLMCKGMKSLSLRAGIRNIWNTLYEPSGYTYSYYASGNLSTQNYYYPQAGRRWVAGLVASF